VYEIPTACVITLLTWDVGGLVTLARFFGLVNDDSSDIAVEITPLSAFLAGAGAPSFNDRSAGLLCNLEEIDAPVSNLDLGVVFDGFT
jgi:hypothetical protein